MKTLKIIRKWETCSSIEAVKNKTACFSFAESCQLLKTEDRSSSHYISGYNDFEASFLHGADHALAGPPMRRFSRVVLYDYVGEGGGGSKLVSPGRLLTASVSDSFGSVPEQ